MRGFFAHKTLLSWHFVYSFLSHMVMMFPYTDDSLTEFNFEGTAVLARSSGEDVSSFSVAYSDTQTSAELQMSLDSQGCF